MIYTEVLLSQRTRPSLSGEKFMTYDPSINQRFKKIYEPQSTLRGEFGCAYAREAIPPTSASFLCCNRQVNAEMTETLARLKKKALVSVKLDCIAEDESFHYFTWLGIPLVSTSWTMQSQSARGMLPTWLGRLLTSSNAGPMKPTSTTRIPRLWIDVRIMGDRMSKWRRNSSPADRTGWAICAALKRLFDRGPYLAAERDQPASRVLSVDELVLNVIPPPPTASLYSPTGMAPAKLLDEDFPLDGVKEGTVHPRTVAKELVNVWGKIWAGDEFKGIFYGGLLEKIGWVRICVGGETFRVRELRGVLERGQKERRRIAERVGW
ncbi:uncharacterized protein N0V89_000410 [Didymosphaeria variabile]|uniref:Uncharacterized protein n=1 Tax=Didymosphaeria variabile TaxID=1932322 RepID=A0A9W9CFN8_9PLEO|nr:uncharacterized protein N0V89_000410 [Didymosphaeria variabile]KAJ4359854.1 hypothetical protein N0V89_000410 [Didymosphaeria variabile]